MEKFLNSDDFQKDDIVVFDHNHDGRLRGRIFGVAYRYKRKPFAVKEYHVVVGTESYHIEPISLHNIRQTTIEVVNSRGKKRKTTLDSALFNSILTSASLHNSAQLKEAKICTVDFSKSTYPETEFEMGHEAYKSFLERQKDIDDLFKLWETK